MELIYIWGEDTMEIRMIYKNGKANVIIIEDMHDQFIETEEAIKACIDELAELTKSVKKEERKG